MASRNPLSALLCLLASTTEELNLSLHPQNRRGEIWIGNHQIANEFVIVFAPYSEEQWHQNNYLTGALLTSGNLFEGVMLYLAGVGTRGA